MSVVAMMSPLWQALTGAMKGAVMFLLAQQVWRQHKGHSQRNSLTWNLIRLILSVAHHWFHCLRNEWRTNADSLYFANASEEKYMILKSYQFLISILFHFYFVTFLSPPACFPIHLLTLPSAKSWSPSHLNMFKPECQLSIFAFLLVYCS